MLWASQQVYILQKYANPTVNTCDSAENIHYLDDLLAETHLSSPTSFLGARLPNLQISKIMYLEN